MIRRVLNAYAAELGKLAHRTIGYAAFGVAIIGVLLAAVFERVGEAAVRLESGARAAAPANGFVAFADGLAWGVGAGAMFLLIFAGLFMAEETELGTAKVVFSKPIRRTEVVLAKGLLLLTLSVALVTVVALASALVAGAFFGFGDVVERDAHGDVIYVYHTAAVMFGHVLRALPQIVPPLFAALAIAFVMSALAEQSGIAVGLSFGFLVASMAGTWLSNRAAPYLLTSYFGFATDTLRSFATGLSTADWSEPWPTWPKGPSKLLLGLAVPAAYALLAWAVAALVTARRAILLLLVSGSLAVALLLGPGPGTAEALAAEAPRFKIVTLEVTGQVWAVRPADLDQDGLVDLLVFHVIGRKGSEPRRFLSTFYARKDGYPPAPDQTIEVGGEACVRFVADVDPTAAGLEIGFIGPRGAWCLAAKDRRFDERSPRWLLTEPGFFDIAAGTQIPSWDGLVKDIDGDGRADVVVPKKGSFAFHFQKTSGGFVRGGEFPLDYRQYFGTRIETLLLNRFVNYWAALSKPALADLDGDHKLDLVTYHESGLDVFRQRPDAAPGARFPPDPDGRMPLGIESEDSRAEDDSYNAVRAYFDDVDGDGFADLILYRNVGKIGLFESMRTQVLFYRGGPLRGPKGAAGETGRAGWRQDAPDQVLNLQGVSISPALIDVDRDGAKDLVVSSLRTDLMTNVKRALFSSVTITYYVFRYDKEEKRFGEKPDYSHDLSIDVARLEGGGTIPLALFWGDYDGDKIPDLLSLESSERVRIFPGRVERSWWSGDSLDYDEGEAIEVEIETSNSIKIEDLNRDGKSDFLFWYWDKNWESKDRGAIRVALTQ